MPMRRKMSVLALYEFSGVVLHILRRLFIVAAQYSDHYLLPAHFQREECRRDSLLHKIGGETGGKRRLPNARARRDEEEIPGAKGATEERVHLRVPRGGDHVGFCVFLDALLLFLDSPLDEIGHCFRALKKRSRLVFCRVVVPNGRDAMTQGYGFALHSV